MQNPNKCKTRFARRLSFLFALTLLSPLTALAAEQNPFGLGVIFGEPTALTAKYWTNSREAVDMGLGYDFNDFFLIYGDYLWHFPEWFAGLNAKMRSGHLTPYLGVGGVLWVSTVSNNQSYFGDHGSVGLGVRIPIGLEWQPGKPPIGVYAEIVPGVGVIPAVFGFVQGGVGIRVYF